MKYEVLKEIVEKITQIEKTFQNLSNPITHTSPKKIKSKLDLYTNFTIFYLHQKSPFQKMASPRPLFQSQPREPPPPLPAYLSGL